MPPTTVETMERALGYRFRERKLCELALTHRSATSHEKQAVDNERMEFLGDSILGVVIAQWLYRQHPRWSEGELTKGRSQLVSEVGLVRVGQALKLAPLIRVGRSQGLDPIPSSVLAGAAEAVLGAVLLDGGYAAAERVIRRLWHPFMRQGRESVDHKSQLQEWCIQHWHVLPHYHVVGEQGPAHEREFEIVVKIKGRPYGKARGRNKKEAQQLAAQMAWQRLANEKRKEGTSHG